MADNNKPVEKGFFEKVIGPYTSWEGFKEANIALGKGIFNLIKGAAKLDSDLSAKADSFVSNQVEKALKAGSEYKAAGNGFDSFSIINSAHARDAAAARSNKLAQNNPQHTASGVIRPHDDINYPDAGAIRRAGTENLEQASNEHYPDAGAIRNSQAPVAETKKFGIEDLKKLPPAQVGLLQRDLNALDYNSGKVDNDAGQKTLGALQKYAKANNIDLDKYAGKDAATIGAIQKEITAKVDALPDANLRRGLNDLSEGQIRDLQKNLNQLNRNTTGYTPLNIDGDAGQMTRDAVRLQAAKNGTDLNKLSIDKIKDFATTNIGAAATADRANERAAQIQAQDTIRNAQTSARTATTPTKPENPTTSTAPAQASEKPRLNQHNGTAPNYPLPAQDEGTPPPIQSSSASGSILGKIADTLKPSDNRFESPDGEDTSYPLAKGAIKTAQESSHTVPISKDTVGLDKLIAKQADDFVKKIKSGEGINVEIGKSALTETTFSSAAQGKVSSDVVVTPVRAPEIIKTASLDMN